MCRTILTPNIEGCDFSDMKNEGYEGLIRVIDREFLQYHTIRRYGIVQLSQVILIGGCTTIGT